MGLYKSLAKYGVIAAVAAGAAVGSIAWAGHWTDSPVDLEGTVIEKFHSIQIGDIVDEEVCLIKAETDYGDKFVAVEHSVWREHGSCYECRTLCDNLKPGDNVVFKRVGEWAAKGAEEFKITHGRVEVR